MKKIILIFLAALSLTAFGQTDKALRHIMYELGKIEGSIPQINMLMKKGEKVQAREMVEASLKQIEQIEKEQQEIALDDSSLDEEDLLIPQTQETKRFLVNKANQLKNSIGIFIECDAKLFGADYITLKDELQGQLADDSYSFVDNVEQADWIIRISASAREGNKMVTGNFTTYFSYVDMQVSIDKVANGKCIYQNSFSEKGGYNRNFERAAREAYQEIHTQIIPVIKEKLQQ